MTVHRETKVAVDAQYPRQDQKYDVGSNSYDITTSSQSYYASKPTLTSAPPTPSSPASNPYNSSIPPVTSPSTSSTSYTYIYTYPSPLEYISKVTLINCVTNATTFTSYSPSPTAYDSSNIGSTTSTATGPGNPFHVIPVATATSSGVACTTSYTHSYFFKGYFSVSCVDRTDSCCKEFGMNCPGEMVRHLLKCF